MKATRRVFLRLRPPVAAAPFVFSYAVPRRACRVAAGPPGVRSRHDPLPSRTKHAPPPVGCGSSSVVACPPGRCVDTCEPPGPSPAPRGPSGKVVFPHTRPCRTGKHGCRSVPASAPAWPPARRPHRGSPARSGNRAAGRRPRTSTHAFRYPSITPRSAWNERLALTSSIAQDGRTARPAASGTAGRTPPHRPLEGLSVQAARCRYGSAPGRPGARSPWCGSRDALSSFAKTS